MIDVQSDIFLQTKKNALKIIFENTIRVKPGLISLNVFFKLIIGIKYSNVNVLGLAFSKLSPFPNSFTYYASDISFKRVYQVGFIEVTPGMQTLAYHADENPNNRHVCSGQAGLFLPCS